MKNCRLVTSKFLKLTSRVAVNLRLAPQVSVQKPFVVADRSSALFVFELRATPNAASQDSLADLFCVEAPSPSRKFCNMPV